jgi:GDP-6-deoxy-D-talose 4-dehydrogenase
VAKIVYHYAVEHAEIRLGNLDLYRDISDIGRVVEAYARLLSLPVEPATINICSGRAVHLADILQIMDEMSGYRLRVVTDPSLVRANEPQFIVGSPAPLETLVGPLPNPDFRETLKQMYGAFRRDLGKS